MSSRQALGKKGIDRLFGENEQGENEQTVNVDKGIPTTKISVSFIVANPYQPRIDFNDETIAELATSIKEQGLLQPIVVRKISGQKYQIISGERRFRALKSLDWADAPVIIRDDVDDKKMLELALVENIQRENLNDIETALSLKKLVDEYAYTHEQLSVRFGKSRTLITNTLRLLKLPEVIQDMVRNERISTGHARALLGIDNPILQAQLAQEIMKKSLSVREVEKKVSQILDRNIEKETSVKTIGTLTQKYASILEDIKKMRGFDLNVVEKNGKKGKVEIVFNDVDGFEKIIAFLSKEEA